MGIEYRLHFENTDPERAFRDLTRLPSAVPRSSVALEIDFREAGHISGMPDATLRLEPGGAYFCAHGGLGRDILGRIIERLVSQFGRVTVEEYEQ